MKTITLARLDREYKNNGQEAERIFRYTMTGEIAKADNLAHNLGTDCLSYQVKSARATVCRGRDLLAYLAEDKATEFAYVLADFSKAYIMSKEEYTEFVSLFGTVTRESAKNGGYEKIRLGHETDKMREWLARA